MGRCYLGRLNRVLGYRWGVCRLFTFSPCAFALFLRLYQFTFLQPPLLLPLSIFDLTPLPKRSRRKHLTSNPFLESGKRKKKKKEIQLLEKAKCKRKAARLRKRQLESSQRTRPSESRGIHSNGPHVERISLLPGIASTSQAHIQTKRV